MLLERVRHLADARGISVQQLVHDALEHELAASPPGTGTTGQSRDEGEQPPFSCIGAFRSGRSDLSTLASEDVFEPEPFR